MTNIEQWSKPRSKGGREVHKTYFLYCGGDTEFLYLKGIRKDLHTKTNIEIKPINKGGKNCLSLMKKILKEKKSMTYDKMNIFYIILDRDPGNNTKDQIIKTLAQAEKNGIKPIISNISIEVRFLMHFKCYMTGNGSVNKYMKELSKFIGGEYSKTDEEIYNKLKDKTLQAIENAKENEKKWESESDAIYLWLNEPYTSMYELVDTLLKS